MAIESLLSNNKIGYDLKYTPTNAFDIAESLTTSLALDAASGVYKIGVEEAQKNERDKLIQERFGGVESLTGIRRTSHDPEFIVKQYKDQMDKLDAMIEQGRGSNDSRFDGIKTRSEMRQELIEITNQANTEAQIAQRNAKSASSLIGGSLLGMVGGTFMDVYNAPAMLLGAPASMGVLKAIGTEMAINAGIETAQLPWTKEWQEELGRDFGAKEAAERVGMAAIGAGAFTAAGKTIGYVGKKAWERFAELGDNPKLGAEERSAAKYMEKTSHIDESIPMPEPSKVSDEDFIANRQAFSETQKAFSERRAPQHKEALFDLDTISFKAKGEISDENTAKLFTRIEDKALILDMGRFASRKQADDFINASVKKDNVSSRADFVTQRTDDGQYVVMQTKKDSFTHTDEQGNILTFKSDKEAKAVVEGLRVENKNDKYEVVSFQKAEGKANQEFIILKGVTKAEAEHIKNNQEYFKVFDRKKVDSQEGYTREARVGINKEHLKKQLIGMGVVRNDIEFEQRFKGIDEDYTKAVEQIFPNKVESIINKTDQIQKALQNPEKNINIENKFYELHKSNPEAKILDEDGEMKTLSQIKQELEDDEQILKALTTCGVF